jgi:integrase
MSLSIKELERTGVPKWCAKLLSDSMFKLYKRSDDKSHCYYVKLVVPLSLQGQLGKVKRRSTKQTDRAKAHAEALRMVATWCAGLVEPATSRAPEPDGRQVRLTDELADELCRGRRQAVMWSAEHDVNVDAFDEENGHVSLAETAAEWAPRYSSVVEQGRRSTHFADVAELATEWAWSLGYELAADDPGLTSFVRKFAIAEKRANRAIDAARNGEPGEADGLSSIPVAAGAHKLGSLLTQWEQNRSRHIVPESRELYAARFRAFIDFVDDIPYPVVSKAHITRFLEHLVFEQDLSENTVNDGYLPALQAVFSYAHSMNRIDVNPAEGVSKPKRHRSERATRKRERPPFDKSTLDIFFSSSWYAGLSASVGRSGAVIGHARFWVPLLQLLQHLRPEEACQLELSDVGVKQGVPAICVEEEFVVEADDDKRSSMPRRKRAKSSATKRWVPVHEQLLKLGWLEFVEAARKNSGQGWLFPELPRGKNNSDAFGKKINRYLHTSLQLAQVQYSLRHTWEDERRRAQSSAAMASAAWPPGMYFAIAGRATTAEEGSGSGYGEGYDVSDMKPFLNQLRFDGVTWPMNWAHWNDLYGPGAVQ